MTADRTCMIDTSRKGSSQDMKNSVATALAVRDTSPLFDASPRMYSRSRSGISSGAPCTVKYSSKSSTNRDKLQNKQGQVKLKSPMPSSRHLRSLSQQSQCTIPGAIFLNSRGRLRCSIT